MWGPASTGSRATPWWRVSLAKRKESTTIYIYIWHEARQPGTTGCSSEYSSDASTVEKPVSLLSAKKNYKVS